MKSVRKLLYRITIIHVILLLALETGIIGTIVHTAHVFVLVICPCFVFVLWSFCSQFCLFFSWDFWGFKEMLTLFCLFLITRKEISRFLWETFLSFLSKLSTLHRIQLSTLSACRTSVHRQNLWQRQSFTWFVILSYRSQQCYIVGSSHSWKQKNITGKRRIQTRTLNFPTQHSTRVKVVTDHLLLTNDESCQMIGILTWLWWPLPGSSNLWTKDMENNLLPTLLAHLQCTPLKATNLWRQRDLESTTCWVPEPSSAGDWKQGWSSVKLISLPIGSFSVPSLFQAFSAPLHVSLW